MTTTASAGIDGLESPAEVQGFVRSQRRSADVAEAAVLAGAVVWAEQHPPESIHDAATWSTGGVDTGMPLAGEGAPLVAAFCVAELAAALGMSTDAGRTLLAEGVELKYRLARTWATVQSHALPAWRARRVAAATLGLSREAAEFVDIQVAPFAHKIGPAALERLVGEAIARFMPDRALVEAERAADGRHLDIHHDQVSFAGTSAVTGELDLADALDLEAALVRGAASLRAAGCEAPLDVRRSMAAGDLARRQLALELELDEVTTDPTDERGASRATRGAAPRQVVLYVHLGEAAITGTSDCPELATVENTRQGVTAEQVRTWCANPDTEVTVKPVIDLGAHLHTEAYAVPDRLREQVVLRDRSCAFPWCTRSARRCDCDHVVAHGDDGPTCSDNLAALCRRHHRLKTHSTWRYTVLEPGTYLWSSPHGYQFLRDDTGTLDVTSERPTPSPYHAAHQPDDPDPP